MYSHTVYPGTPAIMFRKSDGVLAATGSSVDMNADRVILKRVVLTGWPVRIYRRSVVVKWLFVYPSDAEMFVESRVTTKMGLTGTITSALGTHGLVKAEFSDAISSADTVCLHLYKRVFPKEAPDDGTT